jgi:hypothetical protein
LSGLFGRLGENHAVTDPTATDPRLRGRTYAIPFEAVWQASVGLAGGGQRGWSLESTDDQRGVIEASVRGGGLSVEVGVRIAVSLDENAQTRVDVEASSRSGRSDLGRSRRLVIRFLRRLDKRLGAGPAQIVDPARMRAYIASFRDTSGVEVARAPVPAREVHPEDVS